jgi:hypothetical protein
VASHTSVLSDDPFAEELFFLLPLALLEKDRSLQAPILDILASRKHARLFALLPRLIIAKAARGLLTDLLKYVGPLVDANQDPVDVFAACPELLALHADNSDGLPLFLTGSNDGRIIPLPERWRPLQSSLLPHSSFLHARVKPADGERRLGQGATAQWPPYPVAKTLSSL